MLVWWPLSGFFQCQFVGRGRVSLRVLLRAANACVSWFEIRESRMRMRVGCGLCEAVEVHFLLSLTVAFQTETKEILINNDMSRLILIQCWSSGAARHSFTRKPRKCVIEWESAVFDAFDKGSLHTKHYWLWAFVMLS